MDLPDNMHLEPPPEKVLKTIEEVTTAGRGVTGPAYGCIL